MPTWTATSKRFGSSRGSSRSSANLTADADGCDPADETFLRQEIDDQRRNDRDQVGRHQDIPFEPDPTHFGSERDRDRVVVRIVEVDQRPEEIVPRAEEREDGNHGKGGGAE